MNWFEWTGNVCGSIVVVGGAAASIKSLIDWIRASCKRDRIAEETATDRLEEEMAISGGKNASNEDVKKIEAPGRDRSRFRLDDDNTEYFKGRLVLAVVRKYVQRNPDCTAEGLKAVFPDSCQGQYFIATSEDAIWQNEKRREWYFFTQDAINLKNGEVIFVCRQWGADNFGRFLSCAKSLGFHIVRHPYKAN